MTARVGSIAFGPDAADFLALLSRLRWRREFSGRSLPPGRLEVVSAASALVLPGAAAALERAVDRHPGAIVVPLETLAEEPERRWTAPPVSTLSQIERLSPPGSGDARPVPPPRRPAARFVPERPGGEVVVAPGFRVISVPAKFGPREEILARIPPGARRILDIGCGAGETAAEAVRRSPGRFAVGVDRDRTLADEARFRGLDVRCGDALEVIGALAAERARFDTIVLADVLEHFADPHAVLSACTGLAAGGATFVASVPNAAAWPLVEALVAGRFDPIGAGPADAGHLRWFTRAGLIELLTSAGLSSIDVAAVPAAEDGSAFFAALARAGVEHDPDELSAIQWIATARRP